MSKSNPRPTQEELFPFAQNRESSLPPKESQKELPDGNLAIFHWQLGLGGCVLNAVPSGMEPVDSDCTRRAGGSISPQHPPGSNTAVPERAIFQAGPGFLAARLGAPIWGVAPGTIFDGIFFLDGSLTP